MAKTKIKNPFTPEQEAIMSLANKYNALHKDVKQFELGLQVVPLIQNLVLAIARITNIDPKRLATAVSSMKENLAYEESLVRHVKKNTHTTMEKLNSKIVKKDK